jgi:hypothetical protein
MTQKSTQIKTKLAAVRDILTSLPETRDNDRELIVAYWRAEQPLVINFSNAETLLRRFVAGELSLPDDITRARRKVQQLCPELRGSTWKQRQRYNAEEDVRENINTPQP